MTDTSPIDIRYNDLLTWLLERYLIPKDWPSRLNIIQTKTTELMQELNQSTNPDFKKIKDTFSKFPLLNYDHVSKIHQMLLKTESAKQTTLFGYYKNETIYNCDVLLNIYNKNNVYLCEFSKLIIQNISYEITNCEKNISYAVKNSSDLDNKYGDKKNNIERLSTKASNLAKVYNMNSKVLHLNDFNSLNSKNIDTDKLNSIYKEIAIELITKLPDLKNKLNDLTKKIQSNNIKAAIEYYKDYQEKIINIDKNTIENNCLKDLSVISKYGDVRPNETKFNKENYSIIDQKNKEYLEIFSNLKDIKSLASASEWSINVAEEGDKKDNNNSNNKSNNLTCLLNANTKTSIINNLKELANFLKIRTNKDQVEQEAFLAMYTIELRDINNKYNNELVENCLKEIELILNEFDNSQLKFLLRIFNDQNQVISIVNNFESIYDNIRSLIVGIESIQIKIDECDIEIKDNKKKIDEFKKESKGFKKSLEKNLTNLLKRKVTVMGDVNLF